MTSQKALISLNVQNLDIHSLRGNVAGQLSCELQKGRISQSASGHCSGPKWDTDPLSALSPNCKLKDRAM
ncbi:hypothetical protein SDJN02_27677, partial [Cucurbita argyrosperma subsp. argyrosperma]